MTSPDTRSLWEANAPAWTALTRAGYDVFRDLVNSPAFFDLLPDVEGLHCLDVGCGEGYNTRLLAGRGARVAALDISETFIRAAAEDAGSIRFVVGDGARLPFVDGCFGAVTAFMSLMDVAEPELVLADVARVLQPGGFVQFSVLHPLMTSPRRAWVEDESGRREALAVGGYFDEGVVTETWTFGTAPPEVRDQHRPFTIAYARRTVSGWLGAVLDAGLVVEAVVEPHADAELAASHPEVADTRIVPWSLLIRARKPLKP